MSRIVNVCKFHCHRLSAAGLNCVSKGSIRSTKFAHRRPIGIPSTKCQSYNPSYDATYDDRADPFQKLLLEILT